VTLVFNKCDLVPGLPVPDTLSGPPWVMLSALTGAGFDELTQHLKTCMGYQMAEGGAISARARHVEALTRARRHTEQAARVLAERRAGELAAEELRAVQNALGEITGEFTTEDLLGRIFAGFCIGK
jgi:tRNA modification GTPase